MPNYRNIPVSELQVRNILGTSRGTGQARIHLANGSDEWGIHPFQTWLPRATGNPGMVTNGKLDDRVQLPGFDASTQESIDIWAVMPKSYLRASQFYIAIDWSPTTDDGNNVRWGLTITGFQPNVDNSRLRFNGEWGMTYAHVDSTADGAPARFKRVFFGPFNGFDYGSSTIIGRIYRDINVDVPYPSDAWLASAMIYHRIGTLGSDGRRGDELATTLSAT